MVDLSFKNAICKILAFTILFSAFFSSSSISFGEENKRKAITTVTLTVGKDSSYQYKTIKAALDSIEFEPTEQARAVISIASGVYEEDLSIDIPYITFENASSNNPKDVIIKYDKAYGHEDEAKNSDIQKAGTLVLNEGAKGFNAKNITIQNSYNLDNAERKYKAAPAIVSFADKVIFENCDFISKKNTLYLTQNINDKNSFSRSYLKNCYIEGTDEFIYGSSSAVFEDCNINMIYSDSDTSYIYANTLVSNIGYVFKNCNFNSDKAYDENNSHNIYIGKSIKEDNENIASHVVLIECQLSDKINQIGFNIDSNNSNVRFMEYRSINNHRKSIDLSNRDKKVKILNDLQSKSYTVFNILRGTDNWNPKKDGRVSNKINVADITLNNYSKELALGEKIKLEAIILPLNASNKDIIWDTSNIDVVKIDNDGNAVAIKEGNVQITATSSDGSFETVCNINVTKPQTDLPQIKDINIEHKDVMYPGDIIKGTYSYVLNSDNDIDNATVKWYSIDSATGEELLLKEGNKESDKSYNITASDIGCKIKFVVIPETKTTYGKKGESVSYTTSVDVSKSQKSVAEIYLRESFSKFFKDKYKEKSNNKYPLNSNSLPIWIGSNQNKNSEIDSWNVIEEDGIYFIGGAFQDGASFLEYAPKENEKEWQNISADFHMRFNPNANGFSVNSYYDFYTLYNEKKDSYYKLRLQQSENMNSLKLHLYKKANSKSEEILLASDETSLLNKIPQNSGEKNPWFKVNQTIYNGNINISVTLDGENSSLNMTAKDTSPIEDGYIAIESGNNENVLLLESITVREAKQENDDNKIRVYIAGDSTVKTYGNDDTIGGWGEYLQYYFNDDVEIINRAEGGRSTRTFLNEGRLDEILNEIRKGDYLFIQFGANDARPPEDSNVRIQYSVFLGEPDKNGIYPITRAEKTKTPQYLLDFYKEHPYSSEFYPYESGTFKWYLKQYVDGAKEKGAIPVLITPVARVFFDQNGKIIPHHGPDDGYVKAVIQLANETNTAYVDMFAITKKMYEDYGVRVTEGLQNIKSDGSIDISHYNKFGSNIVTSLFVKALAEQNIPLANKEIESSRFVSKTEDLKAATLYILGDSTACSYTDDDNNDYVIPRAGWGDYIEKYLVDKINVKNLAVDGASSKSFIQEKNYQTFLSNLKEGDYVIIQFGHYDETSNNQMKYTNPNGDKTLKGSFQNYLYQYYIKIILDKKAVPIVMTPSSRRVFDSNGEITDTHGLYDDAVRELVKSVQAAYVDLTSVTAEKYKELGVDASKSMQAVYKNISEEENGIDATNYNEYGADVVARLILGQLKHSSATLKSYIDDSAFNNESNDNITRGEYMSILMNVLNKEEIARINFIDVSKGKPYTNAVGLAKQMGIAQPDEKGNFYPENFLTKKAMKEFTEKALKNEGKLKDVDLSLLNSINDDDFVKKEQVYLIINEVYNALN